MEKKTTQNYIPYGDEWQKDMMKLPKKIIIEIFKGVLERADTHLPYVWHYDKPEINSDCLLIVGTYWTTNQWDYDFYQIQFRDGYFACINDCGQEDCSIADISGDVYMIIPEPPTDVVKLK